MAQKSDPFAALLASLPGGNDEKPKKKKKSGGGGNNNKNSSATIKGVTVGAKLGPGEIRDIVAASTLTPEQVITRAENRNIPLSTAAQTYSSTLTPPLDSATATTSAGAGTTSQFGGSPTDGTLDITSSELASATTGYEWDTRKAIAQLQEAGATERLKYEVDNRIPLTEAEYKGKIDLQKIVNAGNRRVANIQRGSQMFASMMGAFNF
jgi:hypothetical protein